MAQLIATNPPPPGVSAMTAGAGQFQFSMAGTPGYLHTIQASTNLTTWDNVYSWTPLFTPAIFTETNTPRFSKRFFRVLIQP